MKLVLGLLVALSLSAGGYALLRGAPEAPANQGLAWNAVGIVAHAEGPAEAAMLEAMLRRTDATYAESADEMLALMADWLSRPGAAPMKETPATVLLALDLAAPTGVEFSFERCMLVYFSQRLEGKDRSFISGALTLGMHRAVFGNDELGLLAKP